MKPLTLEKARELRLKNDGSGAFYVVYDTNNNELIESYRSVWDAMKMADVRESFKLTSVTNSIHCPRNIYLQLTPQAQLDFYLDGYLQDELTEKHKKLRESVILRDIQDKKRRGLSYGI